MISRHWRALARVDRADDYETHLRSATFPALRKIAGFVDASILKRTLAGGIEFLVVTRWDSLSAIEKFTGADVEIAVVPPNVREMMLEYDGRARHYEVVDADPR